MINRKLLPKKLNYLGLLLLLTIIGSQPIQTQSHNGLITQQSSTVNPNQSPKERLIFSAPPPPDDIGQPGRRADAAST